jgi:fibro-slime domain-containing protein
MSFPTLKCIAAVAALAGLTSPASAAVTMSATYYTVAESGDPDFNTNPCCNSLYTNEVKGTLGPNGLPVYNPGYGGPTLYDVNSQGELTWWSPSLNSNVTKTGTGSVTLPFSNYNFFPPNGTGSNDGSGFQAAIFRGVLNVPTTESVTFSFGADDDSFLALDNTIISQEGGIHGVSAAPVTTSVLTPGSYDLTLFYTDRHETGAGLYFSLDTSGVTISTGVPEASTWAMMLIGFAGLGFAGYRQSKKTSMALAA